MIFESLFSRFCFPKASQNGAKSLKKSSKNVFRCLIRFFLDFNAYFDDLKPRKHAFGLSKTEVFHISAFSDLGCIWLTKTIQNEIQKLLESMKNAIQKNVKKKISKFHDFDGFWSPKWSPKNITNSFWFRHRRKIAPGWLPDLIFHAFGSLFGWFLSLF